MRYKIVVSNKESEIEESEIKGAIDLIAAGGIVVLKHIVFNSSYFQAIIPDHERTRDDNERLRCGSKIKYDVSEFAQLLSPKMTMLPDKTNSGT